MLPAVAGSRRFAWHMLSGPGICPGATVHRNGTVPDRVEGPEGECCGAPGAAMEMTIALADDGVSIAEARHRAAPLSFRVRPAPGLGSLSGSCA